MKSYFLKPISTVEEAHAFFEALERDNLLFHPEDNPENIINVLTGKHAFTADEAHLLAYRIEEVYAVDDNPCAFILELMQFNTTKEV